MHFDGSKGEALLDVMVDELLDRAKCDAANAGVTKEDILERFVPSVNMAMSQLFGFDEAPAHKPKLGKRQSFYNPAMPESREIGKKVRGERPSVRCSRWDAPRRWVLGPERPHTPCSPGAKLPLVCPRCRSQRRSLACSPSGAASTSSR